MVRCSSGTDILAQRTKDEHSLFDGPCFYKDDVLKCCCFQDLPMLTTDYFFRSSIISELKCYAVNLLPSMIVRRYFMSGLQSTAPVLCCCYDRLEYCSRRRGQAHHSIQGMVELRAGFCLIIAHTYVLSIHLEKCVAGDKYT